MKGGPTAEELERVKTAYEADLVRGLDRIGGFGGKSDILAHGQVFAGNPEQYRLSLERVRKASAADLRDAGRRCFADGLYQLEVLPYPDYKASTATVDDVAAAVAAGLSMKRILAAYAGLTTEMAKLAAFYATAHPPRGRPREHSSPPAGALIVFTRRTPRRKRTHEAAR